MSVSIVNIAGSTGQLPVTSAAYTPGAAGNQLLLFCVVHGLTSGSYAMSGSATTVSAVSGLSNYTDGTNCLFAMWANLSCAAGSQTFTCSQPSGYFINDIWTTPLEVSGAVSIKNASYKVVTNPGTGAGAISGNPVTVASGDGLLVIVNDCTTVGSGSAATTNGPAGSTPINSYGDQTIVAWGGTGVSITPTFTAPATQGGSIWMVTQLVLSQTPATTSIIPSVYANGVFNANSVYVGGLPARVAARVYANGTLQVGSLMATQGITRLGANNQLQSNSFSI